MASIVLPKSTVVLDSHTKCSVQRVYLRWWPFPLLYWAQHVQRQMQPAHLVLSVLIRALSMPKYSYRFEILRPSHSIPSKAYECHHIFYENLSSAREVSNEVRLTCKTFFNVSTTNASTSSVSTSLPSCLSSTFRNLKHWLRVTSSPARIWLNCKCVWNFENSKPNSKMLYKRNAKIRHNLQCCRKRL